MQYDVEGSPLHLQQVLLLTSRQKFLNKCECNKEKSASSRGSSFHFPVSLLLGGK